MTLVQKAGTISHMTPADKHGNIECHVGDSPAQLTSELISMAVEGDKVVIAGDLKEDTLCALAIKNVRNDAYKTMDASNIAITLSFSIFVGVITGIVALQKVGSSDTTSLISLSIISILALSYATSLFMRILRVNRAYRMLRFG